MLRLHLRMYLLTMLWFLGLTPAQIAMKKKQTRRATNEKKSDTLESKIWTRKIVGKETTAFMQDCLSVSSKETTAFMQDCLSVSLKETTAFLCRIVYTNSLGKFCLYGNK